MVGAAMEAKQEKQNIGVSKAKSLSYKKRKECLLKKTRELSALRGIKVCVVFVEPNGQIETWPEIPDKVREILHLYEDFNRKNNCNRDRAFEPSVKVQACPEITKMDDDRCTKNGCKVGRVTEAVMQEAWDDSWLVGLSKESIQEFLKEIDMKLEKLAQRIDFLDEGKKYNDNKGKETAVLNGEEAELEESSLIEVSTKTPNLEGVSQSEERIFFDEKNCSGKQRIPATQNFLENQGVQIPQFCNLHNNSGMGFYKGTTTSEGSTKTPNLERVSQSEERIFFYEKHWSGKQSIPATQNILENQGVQIPQFCNLYNNSGMGFYQGTITQQSAQIPHQFHFQNTISTTDHGQFFLPEISASEQNNQIPDQCQWFDSSACWFDDNFVVNGGQTMLGCMSDLCPQPMQEFSQLDNLTFSLIEETYSSSLHQNMQY